MIFSDSLLDTFVPELRSALQEVKRKAVGVRMGSDCYALETMPESLNFLRRTNDKPFFLCDEEPPGASDGAQSSDFLRHNLPLWGSKYGGFGFLPKSMEYPRNRNTNNPLALLVQLNLDELPHYGVDAAESLPPHFPTGGILAFYTDPFDGLLGLDFDHLGRDSGQVGYRVLYFSAEEVEEELYQHIRPLVEAEAPDMVQQIEWAVDAQLWSREEQYGVFATCGREQNNWWFPRDGFTDKEKRAFGEVRKQELWKTFGGAVNQALVTFRDKETGLKITKPELWYGKPIKHECAARLGPAMEMVPMRSVEVVNQLIPAARAKHPQLADPGFYDPPLTEEYQFKYIETYRQHKAESGGRPERLGVHIPRMSHLGGFPRFTQNDRRREWSLEEAPNVPRAEQSVLLLQLSDCNENLMFGDSGECNFFIFPEDLEQGRFDHAWFNWDCC